MSAFKDKTYCASERCINICGRKMSEQEKEYVSKTCVPVSYAYFCGRGTKKGENDTNNHILQSN